MGGGDYYYLKEIKLSDQAIVLQNENGPCALIAIVNMLILRDSPMVACIQKCRPSGIISEETLLAKIGELAETESPDQVETLFDILPNLSKGLDVHPRFDGTFVDQSVIFDALNIKLVHGWVLGQVEYSKLLEYNEFIATTQPDLRPSPELVQYSYEQYCAEQFTDKPQLLLQSFVESYNSQLTPSGYKHLQREIREGEMAVLFWNNHFSTITKHHDNMYTLVSDLGLHRELNVVWERIDLTGAGSFVDGNFKLVRTNTPQP